MSRSYKDGVFMDYGDEKLRKSSPTSLILVDSHVHIHSSFNMSTFFDSAYGNFQREACATHQTETFSGVLLLTESCGDHWFQQLGVWADASHSLRNEAGSEWVVNRTPEQTSLRVKSSQGNELLIVAGRQIVVQENLEVLALFTVNQFPDEMSLKDTVNAVRDQGGVPVVPWGFGKWMGNRGKILSEFLLSQTPTTFFLGDNSGRPWFFPYPSQFQQAKAQGLLILPGSDPLPISSECWRAGSAGFAIQGTLSSESPSKDLRQYLLDPRTTLSAYHHTENFFRFMRNQFAMQMVKRPPTKIC